MRQPRAPMSHIRLIILTATSKQAREELDRLFSKFPGLDFTELLELICRATNDDGELVLNQFLDSYEDELQREVSHAGDLP